MADNRSRERLRELLASHREAILMYQTETLYHVQIDWTCQLLDVVDEITDPVTAELITDLIYERLSGSGVSEAAARIRDARAKLEELMRLPPRTCTCDPGPEGQHHEYCHALDDR
jgi:hypothetical protein